MMLISKDQTSGMIITVAEYIQRWVQVDYKNDQHPTNNNSSLCLDFFLPFQTETAKTKTLAFLNWSRWPASENVIHVKHTIWKIDRFYQEEEEEEEEEEPIG